MQDAPIVNDEDIALAPTMRVRGGISNPVSYKPHGSPAAIVQGFEAARIVSQEGSA